MSLRSLRLGALCLGTLLLASTGAEADYRAYPPDVLVYRSYSPDAAYPPPPIPDCRAMAARFGPSLWVGHFSGKRMLYGSIGNVEPYGAVGCFLREADCRRWLHANTAYASSAIGVMSCRPAAQARVLR
jgi:hypothetical protein